MEEVNPVEVLRGLILAKRAATVSKELKVPQSVISLVLSGARKPPPQLLEALGIEKRIKYYSNGKALSRRTSHRGVLRG
jgi:hypothetical protein